MPPTLFLWSRPLQRPLPAGDPPHQQPCGFGCPDSHPQGQRVTLQGERENSVL